MTWNPQATVTIDGTSFTSKALSDISISFGRTNIWEQPRTSYATISLLNDTNVDNHIDMNHSVVIKVKNSAGTDVTLFTGKVTQINNVIQSLGATATVAVQTVTAIGAFADMSRVSLGGSAWPKEYDSDRMSRILTAAGVSIDTIDTPGVYEFQAITPPISDAYTLAAEYAQQAFGYIYETPTGTVGYANESRRFVDITANGYKVIPNSYINWASVSSQKTLAEITNSIEVSYRAGTRSASDSTSQTTYGVKAATLSTELHNSTDAQTQADRYITLRAYPRTSLSTFTIQLDSDNVSNANRDIFLAGVIGKAIQITALPIAIKNTMYRGFVEGYTMSISRTQMSLTMATTDYTYSITPTRWQDVSAALIWSAVDATKTWSTYDD
jgi:hypothetical protein